MAYKSQVTITRPANTTAYTANDVLGATAAAITINGIGPFDGPVLLTSLELRPNISAIPAGMTSFRLYLYDATPPSALADNAAWDLPAGDRANFLGYVDLGSPADLGSTLFVQVDQVNKQIKLKGGYDLYAYLVTNGAFTPAGASEVYVLTVHGIDLPAER